MVLILPFFFVFGISFYVKRTVRFVFVAYRIMILPINALIVFV